MEFEELNSILHAVACLVAERMGMMREKKMSYNKEPLWN